MSKSNNNSELPDLKNIDTFKQAQNNIKEAGTLITSNFYDTFKEITSPRLLKIYILTTIGFIIVVGMCFYPVAYLSPPILESHRFQSWVILSFEFFLKVGSYFWTAIISMLFQKFLSNVSQNK